MTQSTFDALAAQFRATVAKLGPEPDDSEDEDATDLRDAVREGSCDVCGKYGPIAWHGFAYGIETYACAECAR